ncbi:hematopoietically-expressed homeobox protein HHEX homolog [Bombyx mandarina]|uniref:Homeobox domain-containing protein n=2 Tax=Bombyx TaxID=7090 RepID=A0A8R2CAE0_BOMMO|nr:hematopoietically-expressed homeobox protein HHEX homolog [Bombyx mori]XP_028040552.1 hematopoietically-expressed homeobox protein HHEX homolog [Bombyx mandarina]
MCACKQRKSFLIDDILQDVRTKPYAPFRNEPTKPLTCTKTQPSENKTKSNHENAARLNAVCEVRNEMEIDRMAFEQRRNTYPLHPTPIKPNLTWPHRKDPLYLEPRLAYYSDAVLNNNHLLRNQLAANRFFSHPYTLRQAYGFDRVPSNCCNPWWGLGGRRKGGQVRFTAAQTGALERRFNASKYLSPDERRALATTLRLSDRQVKTWFQNRRAKWRRTTPDAADAGSPPTADEGSDDEVHIADDE